MGKIVQISAGVQLYLSILPDGTVLATGHNDNGECNVSS